MELSIENMLKCNFAGRDYGSCAVSDQHGWRPRRSTNWPAPAMFSPSCRRTELRIVSASPSQRSRLGYPG